MNTLKANSLPCYLQICSFHLIRDLISYYFTQQSTYFHISINGRKSSQKLGITDDSFLRFYAIIIQSNANPCHFYFWHFSQTCLLPCTLISTLLSRPSSFHAKITVIASLLLYSCFSLNHFPLFRKSLNHCSTVHIMTVSC